MFSRRERWMAGVACALSLAALPAIPASSSVPSPAPPPVALRKEDFSTKAIRDFGSKVVIDSSGAAWVGRHVRLEDTPVTHVSLTQGSASFNRFGYLGLDTSLSRWRSVNSDLGLAIEGKSGYALPCILTRDRTLAFEKATVTALVYAPDGSIELKKEGKLDGKRPYFSFRKNSPLRQMVQFDLGEQVTISLAKHWDAAQGQGILFSTSSSARKVHIFIPFKKNTAAYSRRAHAVVSSTYPAGTPQTPASCLVAAATLVPPSDIARFPGIEEHFVKGRMITLSLNRKP